MCRVLHVLGGVIFERHLPTEQLDRSVPHVPGVPIGIRCHAESPDHWQPPRDRPACQPLGHLEAYLPKRALDDPQGHPSDGQTIADTHDHIPDRLACGMTKQAIEHLLLGQDGRFAISRRNIGHHLCLDLPHGDEVGEDGEHPPRTWRERQGPGGPGGFERRPAYDRTAADFRGLTGRLRGGQDVHDHLKKLLHELIEPSIRWW
jgi:hypothetical protein